jgi:hypothetical protein
MKKWLQTAKSDDRGESLRALQEVCKERITSVANQYFTKLWGVGEKQGRGAPSIEYRDRQKAKEQCVKTFLEKYDTVTAPSGEGQVVRKRMTVQVEQWWDSSDVVSSLREENAWGADDTVAVVGKRKKCVASGGSTTPTETSPLLSSSGHPERAKPWYLSSSCEASTQTCPVKCVGSFISTDRTTLPELIPVTVDPGNI